MSDGINRCTLLGNIGSDPELRSTQGGMPVLSFSLATNESYLDRDKQRQERTEWHNVVCFGKRGEALGKFLKKGFGLLVEGSIRTRTWDDRDGRKCYKTEIIASNIVVTRGDRKDEPRGGQHRETHASDYGGGSRQGYGAPRTQQGMRQQTPPPANDAPPPDDFGYDSGDDQLPF